jgi:hypothetical protein
MKFANLKVTNLQSENHKSFVLPNGSVLYIKHPNDKGSQSQWWRTWTNKANIKTNKTFLPILGGFSSRTDMHMVFIDFDFLPKQFKSWDELADYCEREVEGTCVLRSVSNKVKLCMILKWVGEQTIPNTELLPVIINDILPEPLKDQFDKKGMTSTYLTESIATKLHEFLEKPAFFTAREAAYSNIVLESVNNTEIVQYFINSDPLPENEFVSNTAGWKDREKFLRVLTAMHNLKTGFGLPQKSLAAFLGTKQATISVWIKRLVELGWLKPISRSYIVGIRAINYTAHGQLLEMIKQHEQSQQFPTVLPRHLPNDGEYYNFLCSLSKRCKSWSEFSLALENIPDIVKKGRLRMAYAIRRCDDRKSRRTLDDENEQV